MRRSDLARTPLTAPYNNPPYVLLDEQESASIGLAKGPGDSWARKLLSNICSEVVIEPTKEIKISDCHILMLAANNDTCNLRVESIAKNERKVININLRKGLSIMCLCFLEEKESQTTFSIDSSNYLTMLKGEYGRILLEVSGEKVVNYGRFPNELKWDALCTCSNAVIDSGQIFKVWWITVPGCTLHSPEQMKFKTFRSCRVCSSSEACQC